MKELTQEKMKELTQEEMREVIGGHVRREHLHNVDRTPRREHKGAHYHGPSRSGRTEQTRD